MKIFFVKTSLGTSSMSFFDMGIGSMSAVLKQLGNETRYFSVDSLDDINYLLEVVDDYRPRIVAFSATESAFFYINNIASLLKEKHPEIFVVLGGVFVTLYPQVIEETTHFDGICLGEGENAMAELVTTLASNKDPTMIKGWWFNKNGKIIKNPIRTEMVNINQLPTPDRDIFLKDGCLYWGGNDHYGRGMEFIFSRGCPFNCSYCSNHALNTFYGGKYVRFKDPKLAIAEIDEVVSEYRSDYFVFHDDTFTVNHQWLGEFLNLYRKYRIPFECNIRVDTVTKDILESLKNAGCYLVRMGIESGDEELRKEILKKNISNDQIEKVVRWCREVGLKTDVSLMIGFPGETSKKFLETVDLVARIKPDYYVLYIFYPYKGTQLFEVCKKGGYLVNKKFEINFLERKDTILKLPSFSRYEILYCVNNFQKLVEMFSNGDSKFKQWHCKYLFKLMIWNPQGRGYWLSQRWLRFENSLRKLLK